MPSRLKRLISPTDPEAARLAKLTEAVADDLPGDVRRSVGALPSDNAATATSKWQRAVTEGLADVQARLADGGGQFVHIQDAPSSTWNIAHNMGGYPAVAVVDSANRVGFGEVEYLDVNRLKVSFSAGFSGRAYLVL